jgi:sulfide:quinone oxidoreductase
LRSALSLARYEHAITIDGRRLGEAFHGLLQDVEGGYIRAIAFVSPGRMAWPLPIYELALMTAARAPRWPARGCLGDLSSR